MPIQAVLFDLDNTLWYVAEAPDDREVYALQAEAVTPALKAVAPRLAPLDFVREFWGRHFDWTDFGGEGLQDLRWRSGPAKVRACLASMCETECSASDAELLWLALNSLPSKVYGVRLYPDAIATLEALRRQGLRVAVVTARPFSAAVVGLGLASVGAAGVFDAIVTSGDVGFRKPHPSLFETAMRDLGVVPAEALMVGDSYEHDVVPAAGLGMTTALKLGEGPPPDSWALARYVIRSLAEVPALDCLTPDRSETAVGGAPAAVTP